MSTQRITISLPKYLYGQLISIVPQRKRSNFVAKAVERKIIETKSVVAKNPITEFLKWRDKYPIHLTNKQILAAIRKGRT